MQVERVAFRRATTALAALTVGVCQCLAASEPGNPISFSRVIAPVLQDKCVTCHGPEKQKGGYRLDSYEWLRVPGENGDEPIIATQPDRSALFRLVTTTDADERMPQKDDALPAEFINSLRRWIKDGARFDGESPKQALVDLLPAAAHPVPPEHYPHALPVLSIALVDEDRAVAIGGYHEILVRALPSGELRARLTNLPERIHALVPIDAGSRLVYAGGSPGRAGEVGLISLDWSAGSPAGGTIGHRILARATDTFLAAAVSRDGKMLAVAGSDKIVRLIELTSGRERRRLTQHADWVLSLDFDAAGTRLASASRDGTARVFDLTTGEMISAFRGHDSPVFGVMFFGDDTQAASAGRDGRVRFWKTDKAEQTGQTDALGGDLLRLIRAGDELLAAGGDGSLRLISASSRKIERTWAASQGGALALAWAKEPWRVLSGDTVGEIKLWTRQEATSSGYFKAGP